MISAQYSTDGFARYANDALSKANNCSLVTEAEFGKSYAKPRFDSGSESRVYLMSTKEIEECDELLVCYGDSYWQETD